MKKKGIDVSYHQGNINWNKVKNAGIEFAIIRIGYGMYDYQKDKQFENNYKNARANRIPVGVYHYSYATSVEEAEKEANLVVKWLNGRDLDYPVYFDIEDSSQAKLGKSTLNAMCRAFCEIIENGSDNFWEDSDLYYAKEFKNALYKHEVGGKVSGSNSTASKKSNEEIANEVIAGKWGNGNARKTALTNAGYDYNTIQNNCISYKQNNIDPNDQCRKTIRHWFANLMLTN